MAIIDQAFGHVRFNINILWIKSQKGRRYIYIYFTVELLSGIQWNFYSGDTLGTKASVR